MPAHFVGDGEWVNGGYSGAQGYRSMKSDRVQWSVGACDGNDISF
jgi:hypothetical protein